MRRAFTLVELLVEIGIIAVLIGVLLPVLRGVARGTARPSPARAGYGPLISQTGGGVMLW